MAYPASTQTLHDTLGRVNRTALTTQRQVQQLRNDSAAGDTIRQRYIDLQRTLDQAIKEWNKAASVPGIEAYARDQLQNQTLDLATEFSAMVTAATNLRDWINTNFPRDATTGAVLLKTVDTAGTETPLVFTTAQTAGFRTQADAFIATVG